MQCWRKSTMRLRATSLLSNYRCDNCGQVLSADAFYKSYLNSNRFRCRRCVVQLRHLNGERSQYERIINTLRNSEKLLERRRRDMLQQLGMSYDHQKPMVLSVSAISYIYNVIWNGKSAIERSSDDRSSLVLVRWDINQPFSKRNNILLTKRQSNIHYTQQLNNCCAKELLYGINFCKFVEQKLRD